MDSGYATFGFVLIGVGLVCSVGELFLPSGLFLVASMGCIAVGVGLTFAAGSTTGMLSLLGVLVAVPLLAMLFFNLAEDAAGPAFFVDQAASRMPQWRPCRSTRRLEKLRGRIGQTLAPLRPAGVADFDGRRVDVITEGMMVDGGQWVRCIDVRAGKVLVRPVEKPDAIGDLERAELVHLTQSAPRTPGLQRRILMSPILFAAAGDNPDIQWRDHRRHRRGHRRRRRPADLPVHLLQLRAALDSVPAGRRRRRHRSTWSA